MMSNEVQFIEMSDSDKQFARVTLDAARDLVTAGDFRGFARLLAEASELTQRALAQRR